MLMKTAYSLLVTLGVARPLAAQVPFDGCIDRRDRPVRGIVDNSLGWAGTAAMLNGESVIYWNARAVQRASRTAKIFLYLHECGHHTLGHIWKRASPRWELEAECWAVQLMWESGMIQTRHLQSLAEELGRSRGDATHLGGEARKRSLRRCLEIKTDPVAWNTALDSLLAASETRFATIQGQGVPTPASATGSFESEVDLPGTYDCEITREHDIRCQVFAARDADRTTERFMVLSRIIGAWMPPDWHRVDRATPDGTVAHELVLADLTGTPRLQLTATTAHRIVFFMHPAEPPLPVETMAHRPEPPLETAATTRIGVPAADAVPPLSQGMSVRIRVPALGSKWLAARVARTAGTTPCLLFELPNRDAQGFPQYVFLQSVTAIEVDTRMARGPIAALPEAAASDWMPVPLRAAKSADAGCRR